MYKDLTPEENWDIYGCIIMPTALGEMCQTNFNEVRNIHLQKYLINFDIRWGRHVICHKVWETYP